MSDRLLVGKIGHFGQRHFSRHLELCATHLDELLSQQHRTRQSLWLFAADRCTKFGEIGALMRREGLYSSHLSNWRKQRTDRERVASAPPKRGPKPDPQARQIQHLNADLARVRRKLERAELIIDAQKKLCIALGLPTTDEEP